MKIIAIICARSKSTRFPNKMMALLDGKPLLYHVVKRAGKARSVNKVVVATVRGDEVITQFCSQNKISYYCGAENDIVDRIYQVAQLEKADIVVRVWGDSPLVDHSLIGNTLYHALRLGVDYTYSANHPLGQNVAVISMPALKKAWKELENPEDRLWFHRYMVEKPNNFTVVAYHSDIGFSDLNYSVDTKEDLEKIREWYERGQTPDGRPICRLG